MKIDEAIELLDKLADELNTDDNETFPQCRACEMGSMALTILVDGHDRIGGFIQHYNEIEEVLDAAFTDKNT